jgi:hypothetical protein
MEQCVNKYCEYLRVIERNGEGGGGEREREREKESANILDVVYMPRVICTEGGHSGEGKTKLSFKETTEYSEQDVNSSMKRGNKTQFL